MMPKKYTCLLSFLLFGHVHYAQEADSSSFSYQKAFLHLDREQYAVKDTIWFRAYVLSGNNHAISTSNPPVYCTLIDSENRRIKNILLRSPLGAGKIVIPDSLKSGYYQLVACTNPLAENQPFPIFRKTIYC